MNDKISGYILDEQQQSIVLDDSDYLLVVAGAGSGKTLTILGKIYYLLKYKHINPKEILCISFTKASCDSLRDKIKKEFGETLPVYTFHKLALEILKDSDKVYKISPTETLNLIIEKFFAIDILHFPFHMKLLLEYFGIYVKDNIKDTYIRFCSKNNIKVKLLQKLLETFICLFKCNNYTLENFCDFIKQAKKTICYFQYRKEKIFLILAVNIYLKYEYYLKDNYEIDFNDMITLATKRVDEFGISSNYKYIIIDEYQDTSLVRFNLIKSILKNTGAKLMAVGDDFQSIYRFTGCDLSLFVNFSCYFNKVNIKMIENTYRNSQQLITVAGNFVMKNKNQLIKNLSSQKYLDKPLKIFYYQDIKNDFLKLIENIYHKTRNPIMVLGRNNCDIYNVLNSKCKLTENGQIMIPNCYDLRLYYLTVHKSKGLEEENVVVINLVNDELGFPSKVLEDKVLRFVSIKKEKFPFSEERRLFYVALTRTKNSVYLYVPRKNPSLFVKEVLKYYKSYIEIIN